MGKKIAILMCHTYDRLETSSRKDELEISAIIYIKASMVLSRAITRKKCRTTAVYLKKNLARDPASYCFF